MSATGQVIRFEAEVIRFDGAGGWHAVFLPDDAASGARFFGRPNALGAIAVIVDVNTSSARTSLFPDKQRQSFLLPLNARLRKDAEITAGDRIAVVLTLID